MRIGYDRGILPGRRVTAQETLADILDGCAEALAKPRVVEQPNRVEDQANGVDGRSSLVPSLVTSRHSGEMASVMCGSCGDVIHFQKSCSDKFCGICNARRAKRILKDYQPAIEAMVAPKFLNLTIKSKPLSRQFLKELRRFFTRLCHRKVWKERVRGGFYVIELGSLKDTGLWNVHIHAVMDADYIDQKWISAAWLEITGDSMVVDIRAVRSYFYATWYLSKYVAKPITKDGDVPFEERDRVNAALKGTRLIQRFGNCIAFKPDPKVTVCRKCGAINSYISVEIDIEPSLRHFKGWTDAYIDQHSPLAEAFETFDWWTFQMD